MRFYHWQGLREITRISFRVGKCGGFLKGLEVGVDKVCKWTGKRAKLCTMYLDWKVEWVSFQIWQVKKMLFGFKNIVLTPQTFESVGIYPLVPSVPVSLHKVVPSTPRREQDSNWLHRWLLIQLPYAHDHNGPICLYFMPCYNMLIKAISDVVCDYWLWNLCHSFLCLKP